MTTPIFQLHKKMENYFSTVTTLNSYCITLVPATQNEPPYQNKCALILFTKEKIPDKDSQGISNIK